MRRDERTKVVGSDPADVVKKALPVLEAALSAMLARDEGYGPFLIVEDDVPIGPAHEGQAGRFVQFCGSQSQPLRFEAPSVGIYEEHDRDDVPASAARALEVLASLGQAFSAVPFAEGLSVLERDTWSRPSRLNRLVGRTLARLSKKESLP